MLPFNEEFRTGKSRITQVRLSVRLANNTLLSLTEEEVILGGLVRDSCTSIDGEFTIGAAVTGKLTAVIDNSTQAFSGYDFRNAVITASLGGQLSDGEYQLVQIGIYTVDEYSYDGSNITLTAYDNFYKFDKPCTAVTFPKTVSQLVSLACDAAGVTLGNSSVPNGAYIVSQEPGQWDTMTWHDVIAYCAQIACCFTKILPNGRLFFSWYDVSFLNGVQLDGGTFATETTPYSDGANADGGDFTYASTTAYDGGYFGDRDNAHVLGSHFDLSYDTDDCLITGVSVVLEPTNNINATDGTKTYTKTLGTAGYVIRIENNPLIETTANADSVASYIYQYIVGMRFRPLSGTVLENPSTEAGDVAVVVDRFNNSHYCFLSHVTYRSGSSTSISCDAQSPMQSLKSRYGEAEKTRALAQRVFDKAITNADAAMNMILTAYATTMGMYRYYVSDGQGGYIYIFGNKNTLAASNIRWKFSAGALMVSTDYGSTWNAAISADGIAVFQEVYAIKVNADNIVAGTMTGRTISGGTINGSTINAGGSYYGGIYVRDENNIVVAQFSRSESTISGFKVDQYALRNGKRYLTDVTQAGCILSTDGLEVGNGSKYIRLSRSGDIQSNGGIYIVDAGNAGSYYDQTIRVYNSSGTKTTGISSNYSHFSGDVYVGGSFSVLDVSKKNKAVRTKHYGTVGMDAFETADSHFADIGSGTVGDDGTVTIFFDPIFEETIDANADYQVLLTRTSEKETSWVDKQKGRFVVHGDPGATFDWMLICYQRGFIGARMEPVYIPEFMDFPNIENRDGEIAVQEVEQMVAQYDETLEVLL